MGHRNHEIVHRLAALDNHRRLHHAGCAIGLADRIASD